MTDGTRYRLAAAGAVLLIVGCASTRDNLALPPDRSAQDVPARFILDMSTAAVPSDTVPGSGCRSPLFDPRDGTRIVMQRSGAGRGDYAVPMGRYGVGPDELLRLVCNTGEPLGVVRRQD